MVVLVHQTNKTGYDQIIKDNFLFPSLITKELRFGDIGEEILFEDVYMQVLFDNMTFTEMYDYAFLFFEPKILEKYTVKHWCPHWNFGHFNEKRCENYDTKKSYSENLKKWEQKQIEYFGNSKYTYWKTPNEVLFSEPISMNDCIAIYSPLKNAIDHPLLLNTKIKINKLIKSYKI